MTVLSLTPAVVEEMKMKKHNKLWMIQKQLYTNSQLHQCKMLPLRLNVSQCHNIGVIIVKKKERKKKNHYNFACKVERRWGLVSAHEEYHSGISVFTWQVIPVPAHEAVFSGIEWDDRLSDKRYVDAAKQLEMNKEKVQYDIFNKYSLFGSASTKWVQVFLGSSQKRQ